LIVFCASGVWGYACSQAGKKVPASVAQEQCTTRLSITVNAALHNLSDKQLHVATDDKTRHGRSWWQGVNGHVLKRGQLNLAT
jgi:hypothetical protein